MRTYSQDRELGKGVLQGYLHLKYQLEEERRKLLQAQNKQASPPVLHLEYERVAESARYRASEQEIIDVLVLEDQVESLQSRLDQYDSRVRDTVAQMPDVSGRLIEGYYLRQMNWEKCADCIGCSESGGYFHKLKTRAYEDFWNTYQKLMGHTGFLNQAKECRMWKIHYARLCKAGKMTEEEARMALRNKMHLSIRQIQKLLRLLKLIPELQRELSTGHICLTAAYHLSFLREDYQHQLVEMIRREGIQISIYQAKQLRKLTFSEWFHRDPVMKILQG